MDKFIRVDLVENKDKPMGFDVALTVEGDVDFQDGLYALMDGITGIVVSVLNSVMDNHKEDESSAWLNVPSEQIESDVIAMAKFCMENVNLGAADMAERLMYMHEIIANGDNDAQQKTIDLLRDVDNETVEEDG